MLTKKPLKSWWSVKDNSRKKEISKSSKASNLLSRILKKRRMCLIKTWTLQDLRRLILQDSCKWQRETIVCWRWSKILNRKWWIKLPTTESNISRLSRTSFYNLWLKWLSQLFKSNAERVMFKILRLWLRTSNLNTASLWMKAPEEKNISANFMLLMTAISSQLTKIKDAVELCFILKTARLFAQTLFTTDSIWLSKSSFLKLDKDFSQQEIDI